MWISPGATVVHLYNWSLSRLRKHETEKDIVHFWNSAPPGMYETPWITGYTDKLPGSWCKISAINSENPLTQSWQRENFLLLACWFCWADWLWLSNVDCIERFGTPRQTSCGIVRYAVELLCHIAILYQMQRRSVWKDRTCLGLKDDMTW